MKKILAFIIIFIAAAAGYLYYDWNTKTKRAALEPGKTAQKT
jgi:LPS O-antigen subunit length determinant protein (WzzB/FepE family)